MSHPLPRGSILMKRLIAHLLRAANHRTMLRTLVKDFPDTLAPAPVVKMLYQAASTHTELSPSMCNRLASNSKVQQAKFRQIRYRHDMYEFALLHAVLDSLQVTQVLSWDAKAWLLAG